MAHLDHILPLPLWGKFALTRSTTECRSLADRYLGVIFNRIEFVTMEHERRIPDARDVTITFNLSGSRAPLLRYGFAKPVWLLAIPDGGVSGRRRIPGFGTVQRVRRIDGGFQLQHAQYDDGFAKLSEGIFDSLWENARVRDLLQRRPATREGVPS